MPASSTKISLFILSHIRMFSTSNTYNTQGYVCDQRHEQSAKPCCFAFCPCIDSRTIVHVPALWMFCAPRGTPSTHVRAAFISARGNRVSRFMKVQTVWQHCYFTHDFCICGVLQMINCVLFPLLFFVRVPGGRQRVHTPDQAKV